MRLKKLRITSRRMLSRLLDSVLRNPGKEDWLDRRVCTFIRGGLRPRRMKRGKNAFSSYFYKLLYKARNKLNYIDDIIWHGGKHIRTNRGVMVRTKAERKIAEMLDRFKITYRYEDKLVLEGVKLKPDFHLPKEKAYLEFWGLTQFAGYNRIKKAKEFLYKKHKVKVISIYPQDLKDLENVFIREYKKVVGKKFPYK